MGMMRREGEREGEEREEREKTVVRYPVSSTIQVGDKIVHLACWISTRNTREHVSVWKLGVSCKKRQSINDKSKPTGESPAAFAFLMFDKQVLSKDPELLQEV